MYRASLICINKDTLKEVNSLIYDLIWNDKDKIERLALVNEYKNGDLKAPHIEWLIRVQRAQYIDNFLDDETPATWKSILNHYVSKNGDSSSFSVTLPLTNYQ